MAKFTEPVLKIIKYRWPEVVLIIGIGALASISIYLPGKEISEETEFPPQFLYQLILGGIGMIITWGFLRTACLNNLQQQQPFGLFKTGLHFLIRMIAFRLLFGLVGFCFLFFVYQIVSQLFTVNKELIDAAKDLPWTFNLCIFFTMLLLMKPFLLIPAIIVVLDCKVLESFRLFWQYQLRKAAGLVVLFCIQLLTPFLAILLKPRSVIAYIALILAALITSFIEFLVYITAVKFVSNENLPVVKQSGSDNLS